MGASKNVNPNEGIDKGMLALAVLPAAGAVASWVNATKIEKRQESEDNKSRFNFAGFVNTGIGVILAASALTLAFGALMGRGDRKNRLKNGLDNTFDPFLFW